jgi:hypothetical protein
MNPGMERGEVELHCTKGSRVNILAAYETSETSDLKAMSHGMKNNTYSFSAESVTILVLKGSRVKEKTGNF